MYILYCAGTGQATPNAAIGSVAALLAAPSSIPPRWCTRPAKFIPRRALLTETRTNATPALGTSSSSNGSTPIGRSPPSLRASTCLTEHTYHLNDICNNTPLFMILVISSTQSRFMIILYVFAATRTGRTHTCCNYETRTSRCACAST